MDICLIGKKCGLAKRGNYTSGLRFCQLMNYSFKEDTDVELNNLNYDFIIFRYNMPKNYSFLFDIKKIRKLSSIVYTYDKLDSLFFHTAINGFSTYTFLKHHKLFFPMITDFIVESKEQDEPVLGYYNRSMTGQSLNYLKDELISLKYPIKIITMGEKTVFNTNVKSHEHTYNNRYFFENITHLYFPRENYMDSFPMTLLEGIQNNKQIISPYIRKTGIKDGIDDMLSLIPFYTSLQDIFSNTYYSYNDFPLWFNNFKNFYKRLEMNNFQYDLPYNKFNSFESWLMEL